VYTRNRPQKKQPGASMMGLKKERTKYFPMSFFMAFSCSPVAQTLKTRITFFGIASWVVFLQKLFDTRHDFLANGFNWLLTALAEKHQNKSRIF
jgi:hypothetical protein